MSYRDREQFERGFNGYVPAMQYSSALIDRAPTWFSLGTPAAADDDIIAATVDADAVANTLEAYDYTIDARYGRTLQCKISADPGAATSVIEVHGFDYLGQPMIERFTTPNGSTAILYGKKAFKRIKQTKIITAATNAVTAKIGTHTGLGLPYKGHISMAKEAGIFVPVQPGGTQSFTIPRSDADATAGGSVWVRAPFVGYVHTLFGTPYGTGSTNDPVVTVELGGVAITGLTVTIDTSDAAGLTVTDVPTTPGYNANNRFVTNGLIELVATAAAAAGPDSVGVILAQRSVADLTDPATNVTAEPRGLYEPITAPDGTEIMVALVGDPSVNTNNRGGLHGIAHYAA